MEILDHASNIPDPKKVKYLDKALRTALLITLASVVIGLVEYLTGFSEAAMKNKNNWISNLMQFLVFFYFIYKGLEKHKRENLGGYLSVERSIGFGTLVGLAGGVLLGIWAALFFEMIAPEMMTFIRQNAMQEMADRGLSEEEVEQQMEVAKFFMTPTFFAIAVTIFSVFMGLVCGAVSGLILKKTPK